MKSANRKMWVTVLGMVTITSTAILSYFIPSIIGLYGVFVGGITGLAGIYITGNVMQKKLLGKVEQNLNNDTTNEG